MTEHHHGPRRGQESVLPKEVHPASRPTPSFLSTVCGLRSKRVRREHRSVWPRPTPGAERGRAAGDRFQIGLHHVCSHGLTSRPCFLGQLQQKHGQLPHEGPRVSPTRAGPLIPNYRLSTWRTADTADTRCTNRQRRARTAARSLSVSPRPPRRRRLLHGRRLQSRQWSQVQLAC